MCCGGGGGSGKARLTIHVLFKYDLLYGFYLSVLFILFYIKYLAIMLMNKAVLVYFILKA